MASNSQRLFTQGIASTLVLLACGCSSGGSDSVAANGMITQANAMEVASIAGVLDIMGELPANVDLLSTGAIGISNGSQTTGCTNGGSTTISSVDVAPFGVLSSGDSIDVSFSGCNEGGTVISGSAGLDLDSVIGDPETDATWSVGVTFALSNLSVDSPEDDFSANGAISLGFGVDNMDVDYSMSGALNASITEAGQTTTFNMSGLDITCDYIAAMDMQTYRFNVAYQSNQLGGNFAVTTLTDFVAIGLAGPSMGQMRITTDDVSSLLITAVGDGVNARIEVDEDGDGLYEFSVIEPWDEL